MASQAPDADEPLAPVWTALFERDISAARRALESARDAPAGAARRLRAYLHLFQGERAECADILTAIPAWKLNHLDRRALLGVFESGAAQADHDGAAGCVEFLLRCGEPGHAFRLMGQALEKHGETAALCGLAVAIGYVLSGNAQIAVRQAQVHLQAGRQSRIIFHVLGRSLIALAQYPQALQTLELGARIHGDDADSRFLRSLALDRSSRAQEALAQLRPLIAQPPLHPAHALALARLLRRHGEEQEAEQVLEQAALDEFLPVCRLLLALTPAPGTDAIRPEELATSLALPCPISLDAERFWPDFSGQLDLEGLARLSPALLARVRRRLVEIFPALGTARGVRSSAPLSKARRIGIFLPTGARALLPPLLRELRARASAECREFILIHDDLPLSAEQRAGHGVSEHCIPGIPAPGLIQAVAALELDALFLITPLREVQSFVLSLARLAPLQVIVDELASPLTGSTIDAHCCRTRGGEWQWTTYAEVSSYGDSPPALTRLGLPCAFRIPVPLTDLARQTQGQISTLRGEHGWTTAPILELGPALSDQRASSALMKAPTVLHVRLSNVQVWHGETALWHVATDTLAHEAGFQHDRGRVASISRVNRRPGQMFAAEVDHAFLLQPLAPVVTLERAIVVRGKASFNYFHWLFDGLAALESVLADASLADWPLLIDEDLHPNLEEALRRLAGRARRILRQPQGAPVLLKEAVVGIGANRIPYTLHPSCTFQPEDYVFCPQALAFLRQGLMGKTPRADAGHRRLYLRRRGEYRHLINHAEIEALFVRAGFEVIDAGGMDLAAQMRTFAQASHVAGPTGAAFSNLLFAPPGTRVLLFTNEATGHHFFSNLASSLGQTMTVIHGQAAQDSHPEAHQSDYALPLELLARALAENVPDRHA